LILLAVVDSVSVALRLTETSAVESVAAKEPPDQTPMDIDKVPAAPTVSVEVMAAVLADCELANCVTDIENELAIDDELAVPVTAAVSLDEKVLAPQVSVESKSDAASPRLAN
jgi:hypothetical protein